MEKALGVGEAGLSRDELELLELIIRTHHLDLNPMPGGISYAKYVDDIIRARNAPVVEMLAKVGINSKATMTPAGDGAAPITREAFVQALMRDNPKDDQVMRMLWAFHSSEILFDIAGTTRRYTSVLKAVPGPILGMVAGYLTPAGWKKPAEDVAMKEGEPHDM